MKQNTSQNTSDKLLLLLKESRGITINKPSGHGVVIIDVSKEEWEEFLNTHKIKRKKNRHLWPKNNERN